MSTEANKALVRRYREAHNTNNLALLDEIVAADIKSHNGMPGLPSGLEGGKIKESTMQMFILLFLVLVVVAYVGYTTYRSNAERRAIEKKRNQYHDRV